MGDKSTFTDNSVHPVPCQRYGDCCYCCSGSGESTPTYIYSLLERIQGTVIGDCFESGVYNKIALHEHQVLIGPSFNLCMCK